MDGLPLNISPDLPKNELIRNLTHLQTSVLLQHRSALFQEACNLSLVCPEFVHFPLVNRRDTAIRSASHKLSEDIFTIISCIRNKECIPKTLFKNGKRSKDFLLQISHASQGSQPLTPGEQNNEPSTNSDLTSTTRLSQTPPPIESTVNTATSSDSVAGFFISRELNLLKEEIGSLKADLATSLHSRREMDTSMTNTISNELLSVKQELTTLRETVSLLSSRSDCNNCSDIHPSQHSDFPSRPHSSPPATHNHSMTDSASILTIKTWNCRGYKNAIPYLSSLLEDNTGIIALSEHWLWPFELPELSSLHPDYTSIGQADKRLHEESSLNRGCGGVGIIWKKSLPASPIPLDSDRICGVQLHLTKHIISVLSVYLPSTDHDIEEYKHYLNVLECAISALQSEGQVIVVGDFNAHLPTLQQNNANTQGQLLADLLHCHNLFPVSCSSIATGPKYTYFSGQTITTVDYILISPELAPSVNFCTTLDHAPLNVSDHLPISISVCTPYTNSLHCEPSHSTISWSKASEDGSIEHYSRQVH